MLNRVRSIVFPVVFIIGVSTIFGIWLTQMSLPAFRLVEYSHQLNQALNDNFPTNWLIRHDKTIEQIYNDTVRSYTLPKIISYALSNWKYKADPRFWDAANLPAYSFVAMTGDCDDIARLFADILHRNRYEAYYVTIDGKESGHAVSAYINPIDGTLEIVEVNGWWKRPLENRGMYFEQIGNFVSDIYGDARHMAIRTWDLRHILAVENIGDNHE